MIATLKATKVARLEAAIASSTDATEKALLSKELADVIAIPVTPDPTKEYKAPKQSTRSGIVSEVKSREVTSKSADKHKYIQYIVSLTDGTAYFMPYAVTCQAGDPVNIFGEETLAGTTGYNSDNEKGGILDTPHTSSGFQAKSIVVDTEASGVGRARAQAQGKIEAIENLALKYQNNEKMLETIIRLKGII